MIIIKYLLWQTYCDNAQVTDSASSASAMMCGYKANFATMGVKPGVTYGDCVSMRGKETDSILKMSQKAGRSTEKETRRSYGSNKELRRRWSL